DAKAAARIGTGASVEDRRAGPSCRFPSSSSRRNALVRKSSLAGALAVTLLLHAGSASADGSGDPKAAKDDDGKYYDAEGNPTYKIAADGTVDWYTYSGFRRYHSDCHTCHGPDAEGSSYAPALKDSAKTMNYADFANIVVNGRKNVTTSQENVMPAFGT